MSSAVDTSKWFYMCERLNMNRSQHYQYNWINYQYNWINYQYNSINYQYNSINYQYNSINYQYNSINYQHNWINYQYNWINYLFWFNGRLGVCVLTQEVINLNKLAHNWLSNINYFVQPVTSLSYSTLSKTVT